MRAPEAADFSHWRTIAICAAVALTGFAAWALGGPAAKSGHRLLLRSSEYYDPGCPPKSEAVTNFARAALSRVRCLVTKPGTKN